MLLAELVGGRPSEPGLFRGQVHLFELVVGDFEEVTQRTGHRGRLLGIKKSIYIMANKILRVMT
jgi:hypothetical protein